MKKIYFDFDNGIVTDPGPLPRYVAMVDFLNNVLEIYVCFNVQNIEKKGGQTWVTKQLEKEIVTWRTFRLMDELQRYIAKPKFWFKRRNFIESNCKYAWIKFI